MVGQNSARFCSKEHPSESDLLLQGRMETQAPDIDGHVLINDAGDGCPLPASFITSKSRKVWNTTSSEKSLSRRNEIFPRRL